jgi:putative restriction endonuclease
MAVWWVFQNKSYPRSRTGGYLWAPLRDKAGHKKSHWETMAEVQPGDIVLSSVERKIVATSVTKSAAYPSEQPDPQDAEFWAGDGRRVDVAYADLPEPFPVDELSDMFSMLSEEGGPLASDGRGKQGYLFAVNPAAAQQVLERIGHQVDVDQILASAVEADGPGPVTTADRTQKVRVGQQKFREGVIKLWGGRCAVTGVSDRRLLIASHIKSWRLSNDKERLDPGNGLLLEAGLDKLFDEGLIAFDDTGAIKISSQLSIVNRDALGLSEDFRLLQVPDRVTNYLKFHREYLFLP